MKKQEFENCKTANRLIKIICLTMIFAIACLAQTANENTTSKPTAQASEDKSELEKVAETVKKEAKKEAAEKAEQKATRPEDGWKPTKVHFFVFVIDIDKIDGAAQSFTANVFVRLSWNDKRLTHEGKTQRKPIDEIWNPSILIANRGGITQKSLPEVATIDSQGNVTYMQRYTGPLSQPLKLSEFPFDQHNFTVQFAAPGIKSEEIEFVASPAISDPTTIGGAISPNLSLPDWEIVNYVAEPRPYYPAKGVTVPGFVFEFTADRHQMYYIWQIIIPLVFIVMMSWGAFYINPTNAGAQVGVATSSMLTLIAYRFMMSNFIPRLPYMTRLDNFMFTSTLLVFLTLIEVIITTNLALKDKEKIAVRIDDYCRFIFPLAFIVCSAITLSV